jgi:DNA (cytosine-5)-methyltransferase 1
MAMFGKSNRIAADLFSGAGGLSLGFKEAGFQVAFANDINVDYASTYGQNHAETKFFCESVENLSAAELLKATGLRKGEIDVLIGGPPCQGFSINAPRRSHEDARNHLFQHYGRLVLEGLRPKIVLMENVPGMLSLHGGQFVGAIYELFQRAGYQMRHMVLCAAHYGIPQERWRLFFIGTVLEGARITFPRPTHYAPVRANFTGGRDLTWLRFITNGGRPPRLEGQMSFPYGEVFDHPLCPFVPVRDAIGDLPALAVREGGEITSYSLMPSTPYQRAMRQKSAKLYNHFAGALSKENLERLRHIPPGGSWRDIPHELLPKGMKRARRSDHTRRYGRLDPNGLSGTVMTKCDPHWGSFFHWSQNRALTVREAARIQSFPDSYRFYGSRVSQFEQVGNAVPPLLAKVLADHLANTILAVGARAASF